MRQPTARMKRFAELYNGNGIEAARLAGYKGNPNTLGQTAFHLLRNPKIQALIAERETKRLTGPIMKREERQSLWSSMASDPNLEPQARLRASELLGRSEADFVDRHEHAGPNGKPIETTVKATIDLSGVPLELLQKLAEGK